MRTLHKSLRWFACDFWLPQVQILIFYHLFQCHRVFDKILKYISYTKICHEAKLQVSVKIQMIQHQPKTFQNRRIFWEINSVTLAELPSMLIRRCDRKSRAACAQSFGLWQQATIEVTCHDHSIIACSRHIYVLLFFAHIPFVVNHTINATPPQRLQQRQILISTCSLRVESLRTLFAISVDQLQS